LYLGVNFSIKSDVGIFPRKSRILKILMKQNWLQQNYYLIIFTGSAKQHKAHIFIYLFIYYFSEPLCPNGLVIHRDLSEF
jgi:hypothetical protein